MSASKSVTCSGWPICRVTVINASSPLKVCGAMTKAPIFGTTMAAGSGWALDSAVRSTRSSAGSPSCAVDTTATAAAMCSKVGSEPGATYVQTVEWIPSAPIKREAVALLLSANSQVTSSSVSDTTLTIL